MKSGYVKALTILAVVTAAGFLYGTGKHPQLKRVEPVPTGIEVEWETQRTGAQILERTTQPLEAGPGAWDAIHTNEVEEVGTYQHVDQQPPNPGAVYRIQQTVP